jgi:hypothetical protein
MMSKADIKKGDLVVIKNIGGYSVGIVLNAEGPPTSNPSYKNYGTYSVFFKGNIKKFPNIWCEFVQSPKK